MSKKRTRKKHKLRVKFLCKLLFSCFLLVSFFIYIFNLKITNIYITGTEKIKDVTIIDTANIRDYPKIYHLNKRKLKEAIKSIPLVNDVKIKRNIFGKLTINIKEDKILFFYKYNNKYITTSGASIDDSEEFYGYPTLLNFTPDTIFEKLITGLNKVDYNIIQMINEIEYTPYKSSDGVTIDNNHFTLTMNDQNTVMIDTVNIKNLNKYNIIIASPDMDTERGIIYLDTINDDRIYFKSYATIAQEQAEKEAAAKENNPEKKENE